MTLLELFFPKTIDIMQKERSNLDGPKPIVVEDQDLEILFLVLFGEDAYNKSENSAE